MPPNSFWYLATPYSKYAYGLEAAYELAVRHRALLLAAGIPNFSPIVHSHPVAKMCGLDPRDLSIWLPSEAPIMAAAHGLIVVRATGWDRSDGIAEEVKEFTRTQRPIIFMHPWHLDRATLDTLQGDQP